MAVEVGVTIASAAEKASVLLVSAPLLASRTSCAATARGPGKIRLVMIVCGPPLATELNPAKEADATTKAASAEPSTAPQRTGRRSSDERCRTRGHIGGLLLVAAGSPPDPPQPE